MMPLAEATGDGIAALLALNVTAPSMPARAALPHLRRSKGSVVNVSSTYGHRPLPGAAHYAASKAALEQLTRSWALELPPTASGSTRWLPGRPGARPWPRPGCTVRWSSGSNGRGRPHPARPPHAPSPGRRPGPACRVSGLDPIELWMLKLTASER
jgi:NAD(P)-dependent dehydrogenase (short-subunit alcohol dehydrogenase family)